MTNSEKFFYDNAGFSYMPGEETPEQGKTSCAKALARAEREARDVGLSFRWEEDEFDSSVWNDEEPSWEQWICCCYSSGGAVLTSLCGIDFGRDKEPWGSPYKRVVEAELASKALAQLEKAQ